MCVRVFSLDYSRKVLDLCVFYPDYSRTFLALCVFTPDNSRTLLDFCFVTPDYRQTWLDFALFHPRAHANGVVRVCMRSGLAYNRQSFACEVSIRNSVSGEMIPIINSECSQIIRFRNNFERNNSDCILAPRVLSGTRQCLVEATLLSSPSSRVIALDVTRHAWLTGE